jgi:hypothetical protein
MRMLWFAVSGILAGSMAFALHHPVGASCGAATTAKIPPALIPYTVVEPDGTPIAGAKVYPISTRFGSWSVQPVLVSDATGGFYIPDGDEGITIILPPISPKGAKVAPIFVSLAKGKPVRIVRPVGVPLRVRFLDEKNRPFVNREVMALPTPLLGKDNVTRPLPTDSTAVVIGAQSVPLPSELKAALTVRTDATGTALFEALPQNERVSLVMDAVPQKQPPLILAGSVQLTPAPAPSLRIHLPLNGVITGRVLVRRTGKPLAGANVSLEIPGNATGFHNGGAIIGPKTDAQGRFRFTGLYPATYSLGYNGLDSDLHGDTYQQVAEAAATIPPRSDGSSFAAQQNIPIAKLSKLTVTMRDTAGHPVFGQEISLENQRGGSGSVTNIQGTTLLSDLPGTYRLTWTRRGGKDGAEKQTSRSITLAEGEHRTVILGGKAAKAGASLRALAPKFAGRDMQGKVVRLAQLHGKVVVLDFVYLEESGSNRYYLEVLQQAEAVARKLSSSRLEVLAFCVPAFNGEQAEEKFSRKLAQLQAQFQHVRLLQPVSGDANPTEQYRVTAWPQRFVIGADGTLRNSYGTYLYGSENSTEAAMKDPARLLRDLRNALKDTRKY